MCACLLWTACACREPRTRGPRRVHVTSARLYVCTHASHCICVLAMSALCPRTQNHNARVLRRAECARRERRRARMLKSAHDISMNTQSTRARVRALRARSWSAFFLRCAATISMICVFRTHAWSQRRRLDKACKQCVPACFGPRAHAVNHALVVHEDSMSPAHDRKKERMQHTPYVR